ncbi:MAG: hypothetical protein ACLT8E_05880 [Akkermansia sp.]
MRRAATTGLVLLSPSAEKAPPMTATWAWASSGGRAPKRTART